MSCKSKHPLFKKLSLLGLAASLSVSYATGCGSSGGNNGLGAAKTLSGKATDPDQQPLAGVTVYIPGQPIASLKFSKNLNAQCGTDGGTQTCTDPSEEFCAATCTCDSGAYLLDTSACAQESQHIKVCVNNTDCFEFSLDCSSTSSVCTVDLEQPKDDTQLTTCPSTDELATAICTKLNTCHDYPVATCLNDLPGVTQLWDEVGLAGTNSDDNETEPYQGICMGMQQGTITVNATGFANCKTSIENQDCASVPDPAIEPGIDKYQNLENFIECGENPSAFEFVNP